MIISPNDPAAMLKYADECRALGIRFIFDPSQQLPWLDGPQLRGAMEGAYALTVNDYELEMVKQKTGLTRAGDHGARGHADRHAAAQRVPA